VKKELILHTIDSLSAGGAEILLKNTVAELKEFRHIIVYLNHPDTLARDFEGDVSFFCLGHKRWFDMAVSIKKLNKIIKEAQPAVVHSHLFLSTVVARLAVSKRIPLFTTLHSILSIDAFKKNQASLWLERLTLKKRRTLIAVSRFVLNDYLDHVSFKGNRFVLYNFLPDQFFKKTDFRPAHEITRCVSVGNLKEAKNYHYVLDIFSMLKGKNISLDIYGEGQLREELQKRIDAEGLAVKLCGHVQDTRSVFLNYDLFIQASEHEGFGISVIEAMASKLPVFVSDIPVFKEVTGEHAHFFPLSSHLSAAKLFNRLLNNPAERSKHVETAFDFCRQHYSVMGYKQKLLSIYGLR
jgi:glycosyltransferase involved in cell wall biosynthesis